MKRVKRKAQEQSFVVVPEIQISGQIGGLESKSIRPKLASLGAALNEQANTLDEWREEVAQLLMRSLIDEEEGMDVNGDEYEASAVGQDQCT